MWHYLIYGERWREANLNLQRKTMSEILQTINELTVLSNLNHIMHIQMLREGKEKRRKIQNITRDWWNIS